MFPHILLLGMSLNTVDLGSNVHADQQEEKVSQEPERFEQMMVPKQCHRRRKLDRCMDRFCYLSISTDHRRHRAAS
tara:strand:+ start:356 stop:583 length:228 start_codon:yes stop_codon:yes gene_type:complete